MESQRPSLALHSVAAEAQDTESVPRAGRHEIPQFWYGWQIAITDGAGLALGGLWTLDPDDWWPLALSSGITFTLGAPIMHWLHGATGKGFLSLGVRSFSALSFLLGVGALIGGEDQSSATRGHVLLSVSAISLFTMSLLDIAALAYARVPQRTTPREEELVIAPWLDPKTHVYGVRANLAW